MFPPLLVPWYPLLVGTTNNTVPTTTTQQISTEEIARQAPARKLASYDSTVVIPYPYMSTLGVVSRLSTSITVVYLVPRVWYLVPGRRNRYYKFSYFLLSNESESFQKDI